MDWKKVWQRYAWMAGVTIVIGLMALAFRAEIQPAINRWFQGWFK